MIAYLKGKIVEIQAEYIILEAYGVGYEIMYVAHKMDHDSMNSKETIIYIYEHIKEDGHDLYGFSTPEEKNLFKKLISVSGVGPKTGMQILSMYNPSEIITFILTKDSKALSKVSGIGAKTAQRMILELADSIEKLYPSVDKIDFTQDNTTDTNKMEAIEALVALGYTMQESTKAVNAIFDYQDSSETIIKKALTLLIV